MTQGQLACKAPKNIPTAAEISKHENQDAYVQQSRSREAIRHDCHNKITLSIKWQT